MDARDIIRDLDPTRTADDILRSQFERNHSTAMDVALHADLTALSTETLEALSDRLEAFYWSGDHSGPMLDRVDSAIERVEDALFDRAHTDECEFYLD